AVMSAARSPSSGNCEAPVVGSAFPREGAPAPARGGPARRMMFSQLGVIGCGLMGGSFALALERAGLVKRVIGYSKSPSTTEKAKKLGVIDMAAESALLAVSGSDIVLLAVPVSATEATFTASGHLVEPRGRVADVGP